VHTEKDYHVRDVIREPGIKPGQGKAVGDQMKGDRTKNRVTVYYLLADHFGKLSAFS
jgi:hypothetical protein